MSSSSPIEYIDDDDDDVKTLAMKLLTTKSVYYKRMLKFRICKIPITCDSISYRLNEFCSTCNCHVPTLGIKCKYCYLVRNYVSDVRVIRCKSKKCRKLKCKLCRTVVERPKSPFLAYFKNKTLNFHKIKRRIKI